jgi:hypothetical protein
MVKQAVNPNYTPVAHPATPFRTFNEYVISKNRITAHLTLTNCAINLHRFYPFYLGEHSNRINRTLHLVGTSVALTCHARVLAALISYLVRSQGNLLGTEVGRVLGRMALSGRDAGKVFLGGLVGAYTCAWLG